MIQYKQVFIHFRYLDTLKHSTPHPFTSSLRRNKSLICNHGTGFLNSYNHFINKLSALWKKIWMTNMSAIQHNSVYRGGHEMFAHQNPFFFCMPRSQREDLKKKITHFHCKTNMATLWYKSPESRNSLLIKSIHPLSLPYAKKER